MRLFLSLTAALAILAGCAPINSAYNGVLTQGVADYASAKQNIQATDDMKLRAWVDSACAVNIGALQRAVSTSGNPAVANAVFTACPVPAVGVTTNGPTGTMQVQTFTIPITGITEPATPAPTAPVATPVKPTVRKSQKPAVPTPTPVPVPTPAPATPAPPTIPLPSAMPGQ